MFIIAFFDELRRDI